LKSAYANAFNAYYWEQGQTIDSNDAFGIMLKLGRSDYGYIKDIYAADYPRQSYYSTLSHYGVAQEISNLTMALRNSTFEYPIRSATIGAVTAPER